MYTHQSRMNSRHGRSQASWESYGATQCPSQLFTEQSKLSRDYLHSQMGETRKPRSKERHRCKTLVRRLTSLTKVLVIVCGTCIWAMLVNNDTIEPFELCRSRYVNVAGYWEPGGQEVCLGELSTARGRDVQCISEKRNEQWPQSYSRRG